MMELTSFGYFHNQLMGWSNFSSSVDSFDNFVRMPIYMWSVKMAVDFAEDVGWGLDVQYPKQRYLTKKSYASNFKWKGPPIPAPDEEDY